MKKQFFFLFLLLFSTLSFAQSSLDSLRLVIPGKIEKSDKIKFDFSPNDKFFLVNDGNVDCKIYDVKSGKEIYKINSGYVNSGEFHFLSNEEIYCYIETKYRNWIEVWNIFDSSKKVLFDNVLISAKGTVIIEKNDSIKVIDIKSRNILREYKIPSEWVINFDKRYENKFNGEIISVEINRNPFLLCFGYKRFIKKKNFDYVDIQILEIRNLLNGETYKIKEGLTNNLHLEYSNVIGDVIAITFSNKVSVVSLRTSEELYSIKGKFVDFSPDGSFVITFLKNGVYKVYETYTGKLVSVFEEHKKKRNNKIVFVSDKNEIWSTDSDTNLIV
jgi:WD40 repeat protein